MADTIESALKSVLDQLDERFEVVIVDDGSDDDSVEVIKRLGSDYDLLRLIELVPDRSRRLGKTRNISVEHARGEFIILHVDCDDVFSSGIQSFANVAIELNCILEKDIIVIGKQICLMKKSLFEMLGGYANITRGEDRDLWCRAAMRRRLIYLEHESFRERLPRSGLSNILRIIRNIYDHLVNDYRLSTDLRYFLVREFKHWKRISLIHMLLRSIMLIPAVIGGCRLEKIKRYLSDTDFNEYRESNTYFLEDLPLSRNQIDRIKLKIKPCDICLFNKDGQLQ